MKTSREKKNGNELGKKVRQQKGFKIGRDEMTMKKREKK